MHFMVPEKYRQASDDELREIVLEAKRLHGSRLKILSHH